MEGIGVNLVLVGLALGWESGIGGGGRGVNRLLGIAVDTLLEMPLNLVVRGVLRLVEFLDLVAGCALRLFEFLELVPPCVLRLF